MRDIQFERKEMKGFLNHFDSSAQVQFRLQALLWGFKCRGWDIYTKAPRLESTGCVAFYGNPLCPQFLFLFSVSNVFQAKAGYM